MTDFPSFWTQDIEREREREEREREVGEREGERKERGNGRYLIEKTE